MKTHRTLSLEKTVLAIPSIIVATIMGTTVIHFAGETLVSSLATTTISTKSILDDTKAPSSVSLTLDPSDILRPQIEATPSIKIDPNPVQKKWIQPKLPDYEIKARERIVKWIGSEEKLKELEMDMSAARQAAVEALQREGLDLSSTEVIAIADFTKPSYLKRLMMYRPKTGEKTYHLVSHGSNTGRTYAKWFSNKLGSHQSSPGLYYIGKHYRGKHGKSIRLHGMEGGVNDRAYRRAIVIHSAWYVSYSTMVKNLNKSGEPRIGRSHGCPAFHRADMPFILENLKEGTYLYIYNGK